MNSEYIPALARFDRWYLARAYLIGLPILAWVLWFVTQQPHTPDERYQLYGYAVFSTTLFPYSKLVWDEFWPADQGKGDMSLLNPALLPYLAMKLIFNMLLWYFAPIIAPLGLLYLWLRNR